MDVSAKRIVLHLGGTLQRHSVGLVVGLLGTLLLFSGLLPRDWERTLWGGKFDTNLLYWNFQWAYHVLFERWDWLHFFDANSFYPHKNSLAFADSLLSPMIVYAPLRALGTAPLTAIYLTLMSICLAGCVLSDRALLRLGGLRWPERALVVFAAHFSLPLISFLGIHYQLFGFQLAPPIFLYAYLYFTRWQRADLATGGVVFLLGMLCATYLAPMVGVLLLMLALPPLVSLARGTTAVARQPRWWLKDAVTVVLPLGLAVGLALYPYWKMHGHGVGVPKMQIEVFSARVHSLFLDSTAYSYWHAPARLVEGQREFSCFPGWLLLSLGLLGGALLLFGRSRKARAAEFRAGSPAAAAGGTMDGLGRHALLLFLLSLVLSWGPYVELDKLRVPTLFAVLVDLVPGIGSLRAPGRFCAFFGLGLGILALLVLRRLSGSWDRRGVLTWLALVALVVESLPSVPTHPFTIPHAGFYRKASQYITPHEPLLVLPAAFHNPERTLRTRLDQLKGSTIHWGWLVVGYGSGESMEYGRLVGMDREFQSGRIGFDGLYNVARGLKIQKMIVFPGDYDDNSRARLLRYLSRHQVARVVLRDDEGLLVYFPSGR